MKGINRRTVSMSSTESKATTDATERCFAVWLAGKAIFKFGGDDAYGCKGSGQFGRTTPFTFSLWVKPAEHHPREIVLHEVCVAAEDAAFLRYFARPRQWISRRVANPFLAFGNAIQIVGANKKVPIAQWTSSWSSML